MKTMDEQALERASTAESGQGTRRAATRTSRRERSDMLRAMARLERALARAEPGRREGWIRDTRVALDELRQAMRTHCLVASAEDGLLEEIRLESPQLLPRIEELEDRYRELDSLARHLQETLDSARAQRASAAWIRIRLRELLSGLRQHQALESDLIYEAFAVDIGVGD